MAAQFGDVEPRGKGIEYTGAEKGVKDRAWAWVVQRGVYRV